MARQVAIRYIEVAFSELKSGISQTARVALILSLILLSHKFGRTLYHGTYPGYMPTITYSSFTQKYFVLQS